jgi:hypothetical protein
MTKNADKQVAASVIPEKLSFQLDFQLPDLIIRPVV